MKAEYLSDMLDGLDPELIDSANKSRKLLKKKKVWQKWVAMAACFVIITVGTLSAIHNIKNPLPKKISTNNNETMTVSDDQNIPTSINQDNRSTSINQSNTDVSKSSVRSSSNSSKNNSRTNSSGSGLVGTTTNGNTETSTTNIIIDDTEAIKYIPSEKVYIVSADILYSLEDKNKYNFASAILSNKVYYDTSQIYFEYNNTEYLLQLNKGQYWNTLIGSEIGFYCCKKGEKSLYKSTDDNNFKIQMSLYKNDTILFTRHLQYASYINGFVPGKLEHYGLTAEDCKMLKMYATIQCPDREILNTLVEGLEKTSEIQHNATKQSRPITFKHNENMFINYNDNSVSFYWQ